MTNKLTAKQKEFFNTYARNDLSNHLFPILDAQGLQFTPELANKLLDAVNLDDYTQILGEAFLERVEFGAVKRVDKILKSRDFQDVSLAAYEVGEIVNEERIRILAALIPTEDDFGVDSGEIVIDEDQKEV